MSDTPADNLPEAKEPVKENGPPATKVIKYKLSRKHKRFADAYLLTLNATEAYKVVFKPKCPEYAYKNAYKLLRIEGISRYVDEALQESSEANYRPEAIKQGIQTLAQTARRESDRLRAYELMAKVSGLLTDNQTNTQVNIINSDILDLARKRLQDRKNTVNVNSIRENETIEPDSLSTKCSETRGLTESISTQKLDIVDGVNSTSDLAESVLSTNADDKEGDTIDSSADVDNGQEKDEPRGTGGQEPPPTG